MILKPKLITKIEPGHRFSKGLVGSWLFNEGDGDLAYDTSGNGNHGTLVGDTYSVPGKFGPALDFDGGNDYVEIPSSSSVNITGNFTVMASFRPVSASGAGYIFAKNNAAASDAQYALFWRPATNTLEGYIDGVAVGTSANNVITAGQWNHIAFVYNQVDTRYYVNGVRSGAANTAKTGAISPTDFTIKLAKRDPSNFELTGQISDVTIWDRALNAGEIFDLYRDPFQMFKRNL